MFKQLSVLTAFPSSHASPVSTTPSPHEGLVQSSLQASGIELLFDPALSHSSVHSTTPFPQVAEVSHVQVELH